MVWHRRISPISADQSHHSAADRDFDPPHAATSWSAPRHALRHPCIRCGELKGMEPAAGAFTGTRDRLPLQDGIKDNLYSTQCLLQIVWTRLFHRRPCNDFHMLRRVSNPQRYYYYYYYRVADCSVIIVLLSVVLCVCIFLHFTLKPRPHWRVVENGDFSATISANSITLIYCGCFLYRRVGPTRRRACCVDHKSRRRRRRRDL